MRYIGDLLVFLAWDKSDTKTKDLANAIIKYIQESTYHKFMKLKSEDTTKPFCFLEGIISVKETEDHHDCIEIKYI